ncbi:hypothetical protein V425_10920 [Lactococcus lactis RTB018]|nr:DUF1642 domain-containing protein [Lactococcus lactis]OAZ15910.1 hypothetical protein V425_10920 [Lactococcus lactis RTB018]
MTKFEEEVKRPANGPLNELNNNMKEVFSQYRKKRQYADYLEYESKQKDERILKLENENSFMRDERTTFDSNGMAVEPKLQQQSLPVVPECVAEWLNSKPLYQLLEDILIEDVALLEIDKWFENPKNWTLGIGTLDDFIARLKLDGYTVEKPQLFYLKHIDMSKRNSINDLYLKKYIHADLTENGEHRLSHTMSAKGMYPPKDCCAFTQQEIDSMETGSYEQIEVVE